MVCSGASELSMSQWASAYAEAALGLSKTIGDLAGPCMFAITMGISRMIFGKYGDKMDLMKFMAGSGILCVFCYLLASLSSNPAAGLIGCIVCGFSVGIISQPDWKNPDSISILGEPKIGFIVTGGNMDSMVNHYSVSKKRRQKDAFTPGGIMGRRPDYATVVYCNLIRRTYKHTPLIIGGLEASLRRLGHYDYWSNKVKRSILLDSGADLLLYGMGERSIVAVAEGLRSGIDIKDLTYIDGTVYKTKDPDSVYDGITLPSYEEICASKESYAHSFYTQYCNTDPFTAKRLIEPYPNKCYVVQNPPSKPLTTSEMDAVYALPYMRTYHPSYEEAGGVPAIEEVKFSLVSNRGCYGGCSFCALTFHQGRIIQTRSHESILNEAKQMVWEPDFKGYIHDVGGPTANFRGPSCDKQLTRGVCKNRQCLFPSPCPNLKVDHSDYLSLFTGTARASECEKSIYPFRYPF